MGRLKIKKSIPGMRQHILYISTHEYNRIVASKGSTSINTFVQEAIAKELERRERLGDLLK